MKISSNQSYHNYRKKYDNEYSAIVNYGGISGYRLRLKTLEEMFKDDQLSPMVYMDLYRKVLEEQLQSVVRIFVLTMIGCFALCYYFWDN